MIVYDDEDTTTPAQPVPFRCSSPCNEKWSSARSLIEHVQSGHPDLYWIGSEEEE